MGKIKNSIDCEDYQTDYYESCFDEWIDERRREELEGFVTNNKSYSPFEDSPEYHLSVAGD